MKHIIGYAIKIIALAMSGYHLYVALTGTPNATVFRSIHLGFALVLTFLVYDIHGRKSKEPSIPDLLLAVAAVGVGAYPVIFVDYIYSRFYMVDPITTGDWVFGVMAVLLVLEATRRIVGLALPITAGLFLVYAIFFTGVSKAEIIDQLYLTTEGILGIPIAVSATYLILFVIFGAFVERAGIGRLFMNFALSVAGHTAGGPAKVAVITSSLFGTVTGNGVANVMTTGVFTIPMMIRSGYRPAFSGAVEAVASTGGQILPPIMGASAFLMAEFMGVSYIKVCGYALVPALLYYIAVMFSVHFEAKRSGLVGLPRKDIPNTKTVIKNDGHLCIPLLVIVLILVWGYSPQYAALMGILAVVPTALLRSSTRKDVSVKMIIDALCEGAVNTVLIAMACACAGILVGVINVTGAGLTFTQIVVSLALDNVYMGLFMASVAGIIVGMGIPTAPAYIIQVALLVPALVKFGIPVAGAHLFAFYFAILSGITPPVAIAVYAANSISRAGLWSGCIAAMKLGATGYIIPFMFTLGPALLMIGSWNRILAAAISAAIGAICISSSLHGYLYQSIGWGLRIALIAVAFCLLAPGWWSDLIGFGILAPIVAAQVFAWRQQAGIGRAPVLSDN